MTTERTPDEGLRAEQGEAMMDGPNTYKPDVPFYDWTVLTTTDAYGVRYWFHVPTAALAATPSPPTPTRFRFVPDTFDSLARMEVDPDGEWVRYAALAPDPGS